MRAIPPEVLMIERGTLEPGKVRRSLGALCRLSPVKEIGKFTLVITVVGGKVAYAAPYRLANPASGD